MKNLIKLSLFLALIIATTNCFSQEKHDTIKPLTKINIKAEASPKIEKKNKKTQSPSSKGKNSETSNKIAISDHGLPAEKTSTKRSIDKDKAVVPKK